MTRASTWTRGLLALAAAGLLAVPTAGGQDDETDYAALADDFVRSHLPPPLLAGREPSAISVEELLDLAYLHVDLGVVRIHFPKRAFLSFFHGRTPDFETYDGKPNPGLATKELSAVGRSLAELQLRWVQLVGGADPGAPLDDRAAEAAIPGYGLVREWVEKGWRGKAEEKEILEALREQKQIVDELPEGPLPPGTAESLRLDLLDVITDEGDSVREAIASFDAVLRGGTYWGGESRAAGELPPPKDLVICPTRGDVVGLALHAAREREMPQLAWHPGIFEYTQFSLIGLQAVALHYAEEGNPQDLGGGRLMGDLDQPGNVVMQHAVGYAMNLLIELTFGPSYVGDPEYTPEEQLRAQLQLGSLYGGLRKFMVTYLYGRNQVRDEGDEANRTQARSMFIAGGNSEGGSLGMMPAENSRWRKRANKEGDFIGDLLDNMELESTGSGVRATVLLQPLGSKKKNSHPVTGPFLARTATDVLPPVTGPEGEKEKDREKRLQVRGELARDYVGFLRAYEIAFYKWLVEECEPKEGGSLERHAALYRRFAEIARPRLAPGEPQYDLSTELVAAIEEVYGMPLTSAPGEQAGESAPASLEAAFLSWLEEQ